MIDLIELIAAQRNLQLRLGNDTAHMSVEDRITYIKDNMLAASDELHEALHEVGWKPWASSTRINNNEFFGELRDCWQFLTNLMLVVEPDPATLAARLAVELRKKHVVNYARIDNYDGVSGKCPSCKRALDDISITEVCADGTTWYYCVCGMELTAEQVQPYLVG